jgi:hypothetical protein
MFFVYERESLALIYTANAAAVAHFDADRYGWTQIDAGPDWDETHFWNPQTLSLEAIPTEE